MLVMFKCQCFGRFPVRFVCEIVTLLSFFMLLRITKGPLALTVTPVTVRSVRLANRESQTPVSRRRLLMEVKERRLAARSGGKWTGATGQLMN